MATPALGKGLSALLEQEPISSPSREEQELNITMLPPLQLRPGPYQPRTAFEHEKLNELAESIRTNGVIQPIVARPTERDGIYQIIAGERRWRACKQLGLSEIPVIIRNIDNRRALEIALIENIQRQNLSPIEEAEGYRRLQTEFGYTQEVLAKELGRSRSHIANLLRLLDLPESVKTHLHHGKLSVSHARALITSENPEAIAEEIIAKKLSVREAETFAAGYGQRESKESTVALSLANELEPSETENTRSASLGTSRTKRRSSTHPHLKALKDEDLQQLEKNLSEQLGLKVSITQLSQGGHITINFNNISQLDDIIRFLER